MPCIYGGCIKAGIPHLPLRPAVETIDGSVGRVVVWQLGVRHAAKVKHLGRASKQHNGSKSCDLREEV